MNFKILQILLILLISYSGTSQSQNTVKKDNSKILVAKVSKAKIEKFRSSNDFKYSKIETGLNLWDRIVYLFFKFLQKVFSNEGSAPYIRYAVLVILVAFSIFKLLGYKFSGLFIKNNKIKSKNGIDFYRDDIKTTNFEEEIKTALNNKDYRLALRFHYLKLLKSLNKNKFIDWKLNKTNRQYLNEMKSNENFEEFKLLSNIYEYSWYGDFHIEKSKYEQWKNNFAFFQNKLDN